MMMLFRFLLDLFGIGSCTHSMVGTACITCGLRQGRHLKPCLCQDFRINVCLWCGVMV